MHSRFASAICLAMMGLGGQQGGVDAQESEDVRLIGYEHLALLGDAIQTRRSLRDNVYQFEQRGKEIRQHAQQLPGAQLFFTVAVKRVLKDEVILFVPDARETRVLLKHNKPPEYGTCTLSSTLVRWPRGSHRSSRSPSLSGLAPRFRSRSPSSSVKAICWYSEASSQPCTCCSMCSRPTPSQLSRTWRLSRSTHKMRQKSSSTSSSCTTRLCFLVS